MLFLGLLEIGHNFEKLLFLSQNHLRSRSLPFHRNTFHLSRDGNGISEIVEISEISEKKLSSNSIFFIPLYVPAAESSSSSPLLHFLLKLHQSIYYFEIEHHHAQEHLDLHLLLCFHMFPPTIAPLPTVFLFVEAAC